MIKSEDLYPRGISDFRINSGGYHLFRMIGPQKKERGAKCPPFDLIIN
jgi:hypothetical protein